MIIDKQEWHYNEMPEERCLALVFYDYRYGSSSSTSHRYSERQLSFRGEFVLTVARFDPGFGWRFPEGVAMKKEPYVFCWQKLSVPALVEAVNGRSTQEASRELPEERDDR